jgi:hypothetical protein
MIDFTFVHNSCFFVDQWLTKSCQLLDAARSEAPTVAETKSAPAVSATASSAKSDTAGSSSGTSGGSSGGSASGGSASSQTRIPASDDFNLNSAEVSRAQRWGLHRLFHGELYGRIVERVALRETEVKRWDALLFENEPDTYVFGGAV